MRRWLHRVIGRVEPGEAMYIVSASQELASISLGDRRLEQRAISVVAAIQQSPAVGFPKIFRDPSQLEAFYRLVNNGAVEPDALLAPHSSESWRRAKQSGDSVLVLHDTSEFIYPGEATREGLGKKAGSQSFYGHFALAVAEGEPPVVHGVVGHRSHVLEDGVWFEAVEDEAFEELLVGSERWFDLAASVRESAPTELNLIHVMDREADDYELFTKIMGQGDDFVIRAKHDRRLIGEVGKLFDALEASPVTVEREVALSRRGHRGFPGTKKTHPPRDRRVARLSLRARRVEVERPARVAPLGTPTMTLSLVEVVEFDPPDGLTPVHWRLLSSLPIDTPEDLCRIVDIYRKRWLIEEFFKSLKTGCAAEKRQARSLWSLLNTISLLVPVAWRLLVLRTLARLEPKAPAPCVLDTVELKALRTMAPKAKLPKHPCARQVLLAIARVGGHLKSNGEPGWLVLGRGLEELLTVVVGWRAAMNDMGHTGEWEM